MTTATEPSPQTYAVFMPRHNGTCYRLVFGTPCRKCGSTPLQLEFHDRQLFAASCPTCGDDIYYGRGADIIATPSTGPPDDT